MPYALEPPSGTMQRLATPEAQTHAELDHALTDLAEAGHRIQVGAYREVGAQLSSTWRW